MTQAPAKSWTELKAQTPRKNSIPEGLWLRCPGCGQMIYRKQMEANLHVCPECQHHYRIGAVERVRQLADPGSFEPMFTGLSPTDPLAFRDLKSYTDRLLAEQIKTGQVDAAVAGTAFVRGRAAMLCVLDLSFMMGSMGSVVGEAVTRSIETATERSLPLVIVSGSGAHACRKRASRLCRWPRPLPRARLDDAGGLFISVLTDPTTGGVTASFAMLGDVIFAEPKALIGFAGPRVIQQTIRQELPEGFQRAEYLMQSGMVDRVVPRAELRSEIARVVDYSGR